MLSEAHGITKIIIVCGTTNLRKGIEGLAAIVKEQYYLDPFEKNVLFLFCGRRSDRIKALLWEGLSEAFCYPHIFILKLINYALIISYTLKMCG